MAVHTHGVTRAGGWKLSLHLYLLNHFYIIGLASLYAAVAPDILLVSCIQSLASAFTFHLYSWPYSVSVSSGVRYWGTVLFVRSCDRELNCALNDIA